MNLKIHLITSISIVGIFIVKAVSTSVLTVRQSADDVHQTEPDKLNLNACHSYYAEELQANLETYAKEMKKCKDIETVELEALFKEEEEGRQMVFESLNSICGRISNCKSMNKNLDFFDCVDRTGETNTKYVWKSSKDSSDYAAPIKKKVHDIKFKCERCSSIAERNYVLSVAKTNKEMMSCDDVEDKDPIEELEKHIEF